LTRHLLTFAGHRPSGNQVIAVSRLVTESAALLQRFWSAYRTENRIGGGCRTGAGRTLRTAANTDEPRGQRQGCYAVRRTAHERWGR
jgi:hypothetical protein